MALFDKADFKVPRQTAQLQTQVQAWRQSNPNPNVEESAQELIRLFFFVADAYRTGCAKALYEYTAATTNSRRGAIVWIIKLQEATVKKFEAKMLRMGYLFSVIPAARLWELVDSDPRFQQAWWIFYEANDMVDLLNYRFHRKILPTQPGEEVNLLERYRRLRHGRRRQIQQVMASFVQSGEAYSNPDFTQNHFNLWSESKREVAVRREEYLTQVNDSLKPLFDDAHPCMVDMVQRDIYLDGLFDDLRAGLFRLEPAQEVRDVLDWSAEELENLKKALESPRPVFVNVAELEVADKKPLLESQLLSNKCGNCKKAYATPCQVKDCQHVFCFACIVPWVDARDECPTCRGKAVTGDLVLLDVTKEKASGGDASDQEKTETYESEDEGDEAELEAMLKNLPMNAKSTNELVELAKGKKGGGAESKETKSSKD